MEATTIFAKHEVNRTRYWGEQLEVIHEVLWHGMICADNWNTVLVAVLHCSLADPHKHLNVNHVWLEVIHDLFHFTLRC
ncbi:hypothetical protein D3C87_1576280 [compost metagenome]